MRKSFFGMNSPKRGILPKSAKFLSIRTRTVLILKFKKRVNNYSPFILLPGLKYFFNGWPGRQRRWLVRVFPPDPHMRIFCSHERHMRPYEFFLKTPTPYVPRPVGRPVGVCPICWVFVHSCGGAKHINHIKIKIIIKKTHFWPCFS